MNPATACAEVLVDELVRLGVREAVLCPGSRSASLAFALHAADAAGRLRLHVRTDERSAAFLALGLAKTTGVPAPVVTTSGTAVANLHPAVLEASHAGVPMLLLTADRPPELRGTGANQTTRQVGLFGDAVRWSHDLGTPDERRGQVAIWRATAARAVAAAIGTHGAAPGPAHLNLPFREPLVPDGDVAFVEPLDGRADAAPWTAVQPRAVAAERIENDGRRTLVLVGDLPASGSDWGQAAAALAEGHGWPLVAEPSSGGAWTSAVPHGSVLLGCGTWLDEHRPERVVVVGRVTLSRSTSRLLAHDGTDVDLLAAPGPWPDPAGRVRSVRPLESLLAGLPDSGSDRSWRQSWWEDGRRVAQAVRPLVDGAWPSGLTVAQALRDTLQDDALLFVGSSNPVRDLDLVGGGPGPRVVASRGLAGIDGCVSTAAGIALTSGVPTYALVGDLTFLHDVGGLVVGPAEPRPDLTLVVVNDDGGGIFTTLEPGDPLHGTVFERVFGTSHGTDIGAWCAGAGVEHTLAETPDQLRQQLAAAPKGLRVLEIRVDRASHRGLRARLRAAAEQALA